MNEKIVRNFAIVSVTTLAAISLAHATVMRELALTDIIGRSDKVFVGRVLSTKSRWSNDGRRILTDAVVEVVEDVQGTKKGDHVTVTRLGGTVNGIGMLVHGDAELKVGDKAVLFTEARANNRYVTGMRQGMYRVERETNGREVVRRDTSGIEFLPHNPKVAAPGGAVNQQVAQLSTTNANGRPLNEFLQSIRDTIATCNSGSMCVPK